MLQRKIQIGLAVVLETACTDPATSASDATTGTGAQGSSTSTGDTTAAPTSSADTSTTAERVPGECADDDDCALGQLCDSKHTCDDACTVLHCPEHATCVEGESAECICDDGFFPNAGKCVDRILFALPMDNPDASLIGEVIGFDNDPMLGESDLDCVSHEGEPFPSCYDNHTGTDFLLLGGFTTMDNGSAAVFAAADGEVTFVHDGEYDRCALNLQAFEVQCEYGGPVTPANTITVLHADGISTRYVHLKKNSIVVAEGDHVTCGQPIALVGSSGNSSAPHLHFEVIDVGGTAVDAYAGRFSHPESYWAEQDGANDLPGAACQ